MAKKGRVEAGERFEVEMGGFGGAGQDQWSELISAIRGIDARIAELTKATMETRAVQMDMLSSMRWMVRNGQQSELALKSIAESVETMYDPEADGALTLGIVGRAEEFDEKVLARNDKGKGKEVAMDGSSRHSEPDIEVMEETMDVEE